MDEKTTVEGRVLRIPAEHTYIVVCPDQSAESYMAGLKERYVKLLVLSVGYILLYMVVQIVLRILRHKEGG